MPKSETTTVKGWIGHRSWLEKPLAVTGPEGQQYGLLFKTKRDANDAGWDHPSRVEVTIRVTA